MSALLTLTSASAGQGCPQLGDLPCQCGNFPNYCITTGNKKFTYYKIGKSLVDYVAPGAGIYLKVEEGGSITNVKKMRWQNGVKFAIVQSDVMTFYKREEKKGNPHAKKLIDPLRVVLPLYNEEVHIIVRADSAIKSYADLKGKVIALGKRGGGSAMTGLALYELLFGEEMPSRSAYFTDSFDDSLKAVVDRKADAWVMVVGQPTQKFVDMGKYAGQVIKLLSFDEKNFVDRKVLNGPYYKANIHSNSYPWLDNDVSTIAVKAFLISQKYRKKDTKKNIENFTKSLCRNFDTLQRSSHDKWKQVQLAHTELPGGWKYSDDVLNAFRSEDCGLIKSVEPTCPLKYRLVNLCQ